MSESVKLIFLVAGFNYAYPMDRGELEFYRERCRNRLYERIYAFDKAKGDMGLPLPTRLRFLLFDVGKGEIKFYDHVLEARGRALAHRVRDPWQDLSKVKTEGIPEAYNPNKFLTLRTYRAPMASEYDLPEKTGEVYPKFIWKGPPAKDPNEIMSIRDVYESVRKAPAGSILELSIFSHAYKEGPILINTSEREEPIPSRYRYKSDPINRDPQDFDGRGHKDFLPTMEGGAGAGDLLTPFKNAFDAQNGEIHIWGCANSSGAIASIEAIEKGIAEKRQAEAEPTDTTTLKVKRSNEETLELQLGSFLRWVAENKVARSYPYLAAANSGVRTYGAVPGPKSVTEETGAMLMHVPEKYAGLLRFYEEYLKIGHDKRFFGIYDTAAVQRIKDLIAKYPPVPPKASDG